MMIQKRKRQSPPSPSASASPSPSPSPSLSSSSPSSSSCQDEEEYQGQGQGHRHGLSTRPKRLATRVTILHVCPPVVVRVDPHEFRLTVQKLTGLGSSDTNPTPPCVHTTSLHTSHPQQHQHQHMDFISQPSSLSSSNTTSSSYYSSSSSSPPPPPYNSLGIITTDESEFNSKSHLHDSLSVDYYDWSSDIPESPTSHHHNPNPHLSLSGIHSFSKFDMPPPPPPTSFGECYRPTLEHLQYSELTTRGSMQPFPDLDMSILDCYCPSLDHLQVELTAS